MRLRILLASICLTVAGCHTWQVQPGPSSSAFAQAAADSTKQLRLTLTSGAVIEITSPAHKEVSAGRTALAAGGITTLALAVLVIVAAVAVVAAFGSSY